MWKKQEKFFWYRNRKQTLYLLLQLNYFFDLSFKFFISFHQKITLMDSDMEN